MSTKTRPLRLVVAVGGNALQRRGERLTFENQSAAAKVMAPTLKLLAQEHQVVLTHGNGPQVGELALQRTGATLDVLGAESQGQIGYIVNLALASVQMNSCAILSQTRVDPGDPAFLNPTKLVGPVYTEQEAKELSADKSWTIASDGKYFRRTVPSPKPVEVVQLAAVSALLDSALCVPPMKLLPIVCGGGGVPVAHNESGVLSGVEAVVDKDHCGSLLAQSLSADGLLILTDGGGIWENFGKPNAREMKMVTPAYLLGTKAGAEFPGSMGPKIQAAINFVLGSGPGAFAIIGDLRDAADLLGNQQGTTIRCDGVGGEGVEWRSSS
jgi:carbamate kinase